LKDRKLLYHPDLDSRQSFRFLGRKVGLSKDIVASRVKKLQGKYGVAVVTSKGAFMAGKDLFLKNGFKSGNSAKPSFELMVKTVKSGPLPKFMDQEKQLSNYMGLNIVYSNQCPWVSRSIKEIRKIAKKGGLKLKITELKNAKEVQNAPLLYAIFNLIYNGKLLADHYIFARRFKNIINKEVK